MPTREPGDQQQSDPEPVNPADRHEDGAPDEKIEPADDSPRAAKHNTQREQNQDENKRYDPGQGKRPDQRRRSDKRGLGG